jgi:hypothetical protein
MDQPSKRDDEPCDSQRAFQTMSENEIDSVQSAEIKPLMVIVPRRGWTVSQKDLRSLSTFRKSE